MGIARLSRPRVFLFYVSDHLDRRVEIALQDLRTSNDCIKRVRVDHGVWHFNHGLHSWWLRQVVDSRRSLIIRLQSANACRTLGERINCQRVHLARLRVTVQNEDQVLLGGLWDALDGELGLINGRSLLW